MVALPSDGRIGTVSIPVELDRHALKDDDEYVEHIEDSDDSKKGPNSDSLPLLTRTDPEKKETDDVLDKY